MKFSITGQEKGDILIQMTSWASLIVYFINHVSQNTDYYECDNFMGSICSLVLIMEHHKFVLIMYRKASVYH
jgi:hypothetical protein